MIRRPPRSTLFPYTNALPILAEQVHVRAGQPQRVVDGEVGAAHRTALVHVHRRQERLRLAVRLERSEEHTSELQSRQYLVCRLLLEKKKYQRLHLLPRPISRS